MYSEAFQVSNTQRYDIRTYREGGLICGVIRARAGAGETMEGTEV